MFISLFLYECFFGETNGTFSSTPEREHSFKVNCRLAWESFRYRLEWHGAAGGKRKKKTTQRLINKWSFISFISILISGVGIESHSLPFNINLNFLLHFSTLDVGAEEVTGSECPPRRKMDRESIFQGMDIPDAKSALSSGLKRVAD